MAISTLKRVAIKAFARWLRPLNDARRETKFAKVNEILAKTVGCCSRDELERVIGRPVYSLNGRNFSGTYSGGKVQHADHVEVYLVSGCTIEALFFLQEGKVELCGYPSPTAMDVVLAFESTRPPHSQNAIG
jgi:hypothetical protein